MCNQENVTFQQALDMVESLPEYQQDDLMSIIRRRRIEHGRDLLAENIKHARGEHARGEVRRGTVDNLMSEIIE